MARARFFTEFERDLIRVGVAMGKTPPQIAEALNRTPQGVRVQVRAMRECGTLGNLPLPFTFEEIRAASGE
jgi:IS30 family transposase